MMRLKTRFLYLAHCRGIDNEHFFPKCEKIFTNCVTAVSFRMAESMYILRNPLKIMLNWFCLIFGMSLAEKAQQLVIVQEHNMPCLAY